MSELMEKKNVESSSISTAARKINNIPTTNTREAMKILFILDRDIAEAELAKHEAIANPVIEETPIPTGTKIRQDREEGEYR